MSVHLIPLISFAKIKYFTISRLNKSPLKNLTSRYLRLLFASSLRFCLVFHQEVEWSKVRAKFSVFQTINVWPHQLFPF